MDDLVILSPKKSLEKEKKDFKRMKSMDDYILELSPKRPFEEERGGGGGGLRRRCQEHKTLQQENNGRVWLSCVRTDLRRKCVYTHAVF